MVVVCSLCRAYAAKDLKSLLRHVGAVHSHEAGFFVRCSIQDCPCTYINFHSYKKHLYTKHRDELGLDIDTVTEVPDEYLTVAATLNSSISSIDTLEDAFDDEREKKRAAALFILKAMHVHKVAQSSLSAIMSDFSTMLESVVLQIEKDVITRVGNADPDLKACLKDIFHSHYVFDPFCGLYTSQKQNTFFSNEFHLVVWLTQFS